MNNNKLKDERLKANIQLLDLLKSLVYSYPEQRFSQILNNFDFVKQSDSAGYHDENVWLDEYHTEPMELLERVKLAIQKVNPE